MKVFYSSKGNMLIIFLLFVIAELFISPTGNFALNDDWSYAHSVKHLIETGNIDLGYWPAMTLISHILWGKLICQLLGFSFFALRLSTLLLAIATALLFYKMILNITLSKQKAMLAALFLLFNPIFFSLSNTFMTDVPFLFSIVLSVFFIERYWNTSRLVWLILLCLACVYSLLIRQYGMAIGAGLLGAGLFGIINNRQKKWWLVLIPLIVLVITLVLFDKWRAGNVQQSSAYVSANSFLDKNILVIFWSYFTQRYATIIFYIGLFLLPFLIFYAITFSRTLKVKEILFILPLFTALTWLFKDGNIYFSISNVFYNCGLGPQLLYDTGVQGINAGHSSSVIFERIIRILHLAGGLLINFCISAGLLKLSKKVIKREPVNFTKMYFLAFALVYIVMICLTDSFFDRYILPIFLVVLIYVSGVELKNKWARIFTYAYLTTTMLFSVVATRDYFNWHNTKVELIAESVRSGIKPVEINGGFEYLAYNFYDGAWWGWWAGNSATYYITVGKIDNYSQERFKTYRRLIPFKTDTLFLYKKPE